MEEEKFRVLDFPAHPCDTAVEFGGYDDLRKRIRLDSARLFQSSRVKQYIDGLVLQKLKLSWAHNTLVSLRLECPNDAASLEEVLPFYEKHVTQAQSMLDRMIEEKCRLRQQMKRLVRTAAMA